MPTPVSFVVKYDAAVAEHFAAIEREYHGLIREAIQGQLSAQPMEETRNRKLLKKPILNAPWELRCGPQNRLRVLYDVDTEACEVQILAVGVKERNRLRVGGREVRP